MAYFRISHSLVVIWLLSGILTWLEVNMNKKGLSLGRLTASSRVCHCPYMVEQTIYQGKFHRIGVTCVTTCVNKQRPSRLLRETGLRLGINIGHMTGCIWSRPHVPHEALAADSLPLSVKLCWPLILQESAPGFIQYQAHAS